MLYHFTRYVNARLWPTIREYSCHIHLFIYWSDILKIKKVVFIYLLDLMQRQINLQSDTTNPNVNMASMTSPNGRCLTPPIMQHMPTTLSTTSTEGPTVSVMADGGGGGEDGEECCRNGRGGSMAEECVGCRRPITERYLLKVMEQSWHEDCLKCSCCDCRLGEVGSTLFTRANLMLCRRDYLR